MTTSTMFDRVCPHARTASSRKACQAARLAAHGITWREIRQILGYASWMNAKRAAMAHLETERKAPRGLPLAA